MDYKQPLAPIDGNANKALQHDPFNPLSDASPKPVPAFTHESEQEKALHSKIKSQEKTGKQTGTYVSPSDNILSPASAKLNAFKEKRFAKTVKPRTLFAKPTSTSTFAQAPLSQQPCADGGNDSRESSAHQS